MDIAGKARRLERKLTRSVDAAVGELIGRSETMPIEIVHAVLDRAEHEIQEIGRGRRVFPYNRVSVHVVAPPRDRESRARIAAVFDGPPSLQDRLAERLRAAGCAPPAIDTAILYARQRGAGWTHADFHVEFDRVEKPPAPQVEPAPAAGEEPLRIRLTVVRGTAAQRAYAFSGGRIAIGRRAEVLDQRQRLIRTNDVAFLDEGPDDNHSVSRRHAHVEYHAGDRCYRIWDDRSAHGTSIVRGGRTIKVPAGARGTRLEAGDEIVLGDARLRVSFDGKKRPDA